MREREEVLRDLAKPLEDSRIQGRQVGNQGASAPYLETFDVIETANRIFGPDGWSYRLLGSPMFVDGLNGYMAEVEVEAMGVKHSDIGTNMLRSEHATSHDMSIKGAVSSALKRALRGFGDQFGNSLYDKDLYPTLRPGEERPNSGNSMQQQQRRDPNPPQARPAQPAQGEQPEGGFRNAGDFFSWCHQEHGLARSVVMELLKLEQADVTGDAVDWPFLKTRLTTRLAEIAASRPRAGG